jgi:hypothetical protein
MQAENANTYASSTCTKHGVVHYAHVLPLPLQHRLANGMQQSAEQQQVVKALLNGCLLW